MYIRERSQENKFVMRVFPNTTVNFHIYIGAAIACDPAFFRDLMA